MIRGLRIAVLAKQVPAGGIVAMTDDGRVRRDGPAEINPFCRRAIAQGVILARETGGSCTVLTMGPPAAGEVLAEAIAWGADHGVLVSDPALAGADLQVTAAALTAALRAEGPFDVVLVGHSSVDAETGQLGQLVAGLLGWPFTGAARTLRMTGDGFEAGCEQDHQLVEVRVRPPVVIAVAERLCDPAKAPGYPPTAVTTRDLSALPGALPAAASPTSVGPVRLVTPTRWRKVLRGPVEEQAAAAVALLGDAGALRAGPSAATRVVSSRGAAGPIVHVLSDPYHDSLAELLGLGARIGGEVHALCGPGPSATLLAGQGADIVRRWAGSAPGPAATAAGLATLGSAAVVLVPATAWGREVAGRYAAATGAGLIADAIDVGQVGSTVRAQVCGFSGQGLLEIVSRTTPTVVTVRSGVLPLLSPRAHRSAVERPWRVPESPLDVAETARRTLDDWAALSRAEVVVGVGRGVAAADHAALGPLLKVLDAQLAGTRKLTDAGVLPRSRQIGATGRSVRPRLYVAIGLSGRPHHLAGVTGSGTILAINPDPDAPVFDAADVGIVATWQEAVPALVRALSAAS
ncbi:FAD-binding protein [Micromonospora sp. NPDC023966]|uniref:FAD-binding protein n=1 Tax=Micromonospora sp. NPDC023966 TaxID=3154699 RepID=UPI0033DD9E7D